MQVLLLTVCITYTVYCSAQQYNQQPPNQLQYNQPPPPNIQQYNPQHQRRNRSPQAPQQSPNLPPPPYSPHSPHAPPKQGPPTYNPPPPQHAQSYCNPKTPPKCAGKTDLPYCLADDEYPSYDIAQKISQDSLFLKKYADRANQSADDLVDGITKATEESYDYSYYTGASKGDSPYDSTNWIGPEGTLCPSETAYAKITRAVNVEGYWRIILQHIPEGYGYGHYNYTQTTRLETCLFPSSSCRLLAPCYQSSCTQQYIYHRMVAVDPCDFYRGFFVDTFKLPSACSCTLP